MAGKDQRRRFLTGLFTTVFVLFAIWASSIIAASVQYGYAKMASVAWIGAPNTAWAEGIAAMLGGFGLIPFWNWLWDQLPDWLKR